MERTRRNYIVVRKETDGAAAQGVSNSGQCVQDQCRTFMLLSGCGMRMRDVADEGVTNFQFV